MGDSSSSRAGVIYAVAAFGFWGLSPLYWKLLRDVPAPELLGHRIVWSLPCLAALVLLRRQGADLLAALAHPTVRVALLASTVLIAANWLLFIWAVNTDRILEASLGYYINPLVNVALGAIFLRERLRRAQGWAVALAGVGVGLLTWRAGGVPWMGLGMAASFGLYGLIRKMAPVGALSGLTLEVGLLTPVALLALGRIEVAGTGAFLAGDTATRLLLATAGPVTAAPLLCFTEAARRIRYSTLGFLQYLAPSGQFLLAVLVYDEPLDAARLASFALIWAALGLYSWELRLRSPAP